MMIEITHDYYVSSSNKAHKNNIKFAERILIQFDVSFKQPINRRVLSNFHFSLLLS